jgi:hypothetical protein
MNEFLIGVQGEAVVFMLPVPQQLTRQQAITLSAWLAVLADPGLTQFQAKINEITGGV